MTAQRKKKVLVQILCNCINLFKNSFKSFGLKTSCPVFSGPSSSNLNFLGMGVGWGR